MDSQSAFASFGLHSSDRCDWIRVVPSHDQLFKQLLHALFPEFLEAFVPDLHIDLDPKSIHFADKELLREQGGQHKTKLVDLVARVKFRNSDGFVLIHVEHQARHDRQIGLRLFLYAAWLIESYRLPVYPILLTSYATPRAAEPNRFRMAVHGCGIREFRYRVVQLNRMNWRRFVRQKNPAATALMARMNIRPEERVKVKLQILRLLATMQLDRQKMDLIAGFMENYLRLTEEENVDFELGLSKIEDAKQKKSVMQLMTSWEKKGRQEGRQEGRQKGRQEERLALVKRQLARRAGPLKPSVERQINHLNADVLTDLAEALLDFQNAGDLLQWLAGRPKNAAPGLK